MHICLYIYIWKLLIKNNRLITSSSSDELWLYTLQVMLCDVMKFIVAYKPPSVTGKWNLKKKELPILWLSTDIEYSFFAIWKKICLVLFVSMVSLRAMIYSRRTNKRFCPCHIVAVGNVIWYDMGLLTTQIILRLNCKCTKILVVQGWNDLIP